MVMHKKKKKKKTKSSIKATNNNNNNNKQGSPNNGNHDGKPWTQTTSSSSSLVVVQTKNHDGTTTTSTITQGKESNMSKNPPVSHSPYNNNDDNNNKDNEYPGWDTLDTLVVLEQRRTNNTLLQMWNIVLGTVAMMDFGAAITSTSTTTTTTPWWIVQQQQQQLDNQATTATTSSSTIVVVVVVVLVVEWLERYHTQISWLFSTLWLVDAFLTATIVRQERLDAVEQARLLSSSDNNDSNNNNNNTDNHQQQHQQPSKGWFLGSQQQQQQRRRHVATIMAWMSFFATVLWQLVLLPVGFYVFLAYAYESCVTNHYHHHYHHHDQTIMSNQQQQQGQEQQEERGFSLQMTRENQDNNNSMTGTDYHHHQVTEHFTRHAHVSVLITVLRYVAYKQYLQLRSRLVASGKRGAFNLVRRTLFRHPVRTVRRVQRLTRWFTWIKIVGPLLGTTNKLLANVVNLLKRAQQRAAAQRALQWRAHLWKQMTDDELRQYAATLIQKTYRAMRQRRAYRAVQLFRLDRQRLAAVKLQSFFRSRLMRARYKIARQVEELKQLSLKAQERQREMTESERRRLYQLKAELTRRARTLVNQKLLFRPNTTFAVVWKFIFCVAVVLELGVLLGKTWHPDMASVQAVLPRLWYDLPECQPSPTGMWPKLLATVRLAPRRRSPSTVEWYCEQDAMAQQKLAVAVLEFSIRTVIFAVESVYFADVFINFFTGRFNKQTGALEPLPAFMRWIAPGMVLQLLLNPRMDMVAAVVAQMVQSIRRLGPVRVFRWTVAFFFPVFLVVLSHVSAAWSKLVATQNKRANKVSLF